MHGDLRHGALGAFQPKPDALQLGWVMCAADQLDGQAAHYAFSGHRRERVVLAQQACGLQGLLGLVRHARGLEPGTQRQGAPGHSRGQGGQALQRHAGIAFVQRPACAQLRALAQLRHGGRRAFGNLIQRLLQMCLARALVLQGVRAFGGHQMGQRAQLGAVGAVLGVVQRAGLGDGRLCRLARAQSARPAFATTHPATHRAWPAPSAAGARVAPAPASATAWTGRAAPHTAG
jgi:hypothetical protein